MRAKGLQGQYAGFVSRAAALITDILVLVVVLLVVNVVMTLPLEFFFGIDISNCPSVQGAGRLISPQLTCVLLNWFRVFLSIVLSPLYFALFWSLSGQTVGKYALGVRVVREDGSKLTFIRALIRWAGYFVSFLLLGLGYVWVLIDDRRQAFHDKMVKTVVVYSWEARQNEFLIDRIKRFFRRSKTVAQSPAPGIQPSPAPVAQTGPLALVLIVCPEYERVRKVLNLLRDNISADFVKIVNATVLVKDAEGQFSIVGVSDLDSNTDEPYNIGDPSSGVPEVEIDQIKDDIPLNSFAVAIMIQERLVPVLMQLLTSSGFLPLRYSLGGPGAPTVRQVPAPAVSAGTTAGASRPLSTGSDGATGPQGVAAPEQNTAP